jgi:hypothetical protein
MSLPWYEISWFATYPFQLDCDGVCKPTWETPIAPAGLQGQRDNI